MIKNSIIKMEIVEPEYHNLNGINIPLLEKIISPNLKKVIVDNTYESGEHKELQRIIQNGENILEIGAGIGYISALCRKNPKANNITVFEANPKLIDFIEHVHEINKIKNVKLIHGVLLNDYYKNKIDFYVRKDFWASSLSREKFGHEKIVKVPVYKFNKVINRVKPSLIICDIEGGELSLFKNSDLTGVKKIYLEIHQKLLGRKGMLELFDIMHNRGFHYDQWHSHKGVVLFSHISR